MINRGSASGPFAFAAFNGICRRRTPDAIRGRVFAVITLASAGP